jgi:hypothetical protein
MKCFLPYLLVGLGLLLVVPALAAPQVRLLLPLGRAAYQTNEAIDLSVIVSDTQVLPADRVNITVTGAGASQAVFTFPIAGAALVNGTARVTEHYHLNGWLLRPDAYTVEVAAYGATATAKFELYSHVRKSTFKVIDWGSRASGDTLSRLGEESLGYNLVYGDFRQGRTLKNAEGCIRGGLDYMQCCTMSGAHQMDLRSECDWSDPLVIRGGTARSTQQAFLDRTTPNALGVHFYDEPGLTWAKDPITGKTTPHAVPTQKTAYQNAFGAEPIHFSKVSADDPASVDKWMQWGRWKLSFMDAAWKDAQFGVSYVNPNALSVTQSVYGWTAYADGYYFNVARSLPIISGHGGYDDGPSSYFYPGFHAEFGRVRDWNKPYWYLPSWYRISSDVYRLEQYLSFIGNLQGIAKPPDMQVHNPAGTAEAEGIVESNKIMAKLGTVFTTMPVTRPPVAVLYALTQSLAAEVKNMDDNYEGDGHTRAKLLQAYMAGKQSHYNLFPVVEEDVLDGTLAAYHKAVVLAGVNALDAKVVAALEAYIAGGGKVWLTDDCQVQIKGAEKLGVAASTSQYNKIGELWKTDQKESMRQRAGRFFITESAPLAKALAAKCAAAGIAPDLNVDNPEVTVARQGQGDIEYFFAVNAAGDPQGKDWLSIVPTTATITFANDNRGLYDAVRGGAVPEFAAVKAARKNLVAKFAFGAGQMRAFARTARPIGGVTVGAPTLTRDYTQPQAPYAVKFAATLLDDKGAVLSGSAPLQIVLTDPLGAVRYVLYRATDHGVCALTLPLAVNDPAGTWTLAVTDLLANTTGTATFATTAPAQCGALIGATARATCFGNDRENIFRFVRTHQRVTLVVGTSPFDADAAQRLTTALRPWGVACVTVPAAEVNKARVLSPEDAKTWVGLAFGRVTAENAKQPSLVGYAVDGPVVLIGNPDDNPLIKSVGAWGFLPYTPSADFPGRGRGFIAWQRDAVGIGQESITAIAYDADGMAEAIGTLFEAAAGLDPLTPHTLPTQAAVTPATRADKVAALKTAWTLTLPDRVIWMDAAGKTVQTNDGSFFALANGKASPTEVDVLASKPASNKLETKTPDVLAKALAPSRVVKGVVTANGLTAVAYWGGLVQLFAADGALKAQVALPQDINALAWNGATLVVAQADGKVCGLQAP